MAAAVASFQLGHYWPVAIAATLAYGVMLSNGQRAPSIVHRISRAMVAGLIAFSLYGTVASYPSTLRTLGISLVRQTVESY